jgi:hypothetical protein
MNNLKLTASLFLMLAASMLTAQQTASDFFPGNISVHSIRVYPHPVSTSSTLYFSLQNPDVISIDMLDSHGRLVKNIAGRTKMGPGEYAEEIGFPINLSSGWYMVQFNSTHGKVGIRIFH